MNTDHNSQLNFSLVGFTSILIGIYILCGAFIIEMFVSDFNSKNLCGFSKSNLVLYIASIIVITLLLSLATLYFSANKRAKKGKYLLWNKKETQTSWAVCTAFIVFLLMSYLIYNLGYVHLITPSFLIFYAILLFLLKNKERKDLLIISGVCLLFATVCFLIPSYWYSSLFILGVAHITYGVVVKE